MSWIPFALITPICLAAVNHIDKHLVNTFFKGRSIATLAIISALAGLPTCFLIWLLSPTNVLKINPFHAYLLILNGCLLIASLIPYFKALELEEASVVSPLSQMIPIISLLLGHIFLNEQVSTLQLFSAGIILAGVLLLSLEINLKKTFHVKKRAFLLMLLFSLALSINGIVFKIVAIQADFWTTLFWEYVGFLAIALGMLLLIKKFRQQFLYSLKANRFSIIGINLLNEAFAVIAQTSFHFATLFVPVGIVFSLTEGTQPFFVLFFGILITKFWPHLGEENINKRYLLQKLIALTLMAIGIHFLSFN